MIASTITRSRSFTIPSHHHQQLHQQQQVPQMQSQSQHEYSLPYSLHPGDAASNESLTTFTTTATTSSSPLEEAITNYFNTPSIKPFGNDSESHLYMIDDVFKEPYWQGGISSDRFATSFRDGILYNPEMVNEICTAVATNLAIVTRRGLMIKGPQGSGKSHSIINVVRKLQSTEKYLVTYIADCTRWYTTFYLVKTICSSFGTSYDLLNLPYFKSGKDKYDEEFPEFINAIDTILKKNGKQWVFVFDQINRIFARPQHREMKEITFLPFPFYLIEYVMKGGRITSITSASANSEISYQDRHDAFAEYIHPTAMTDKEIQMLFPNIKDYEKVKYIAGNIPLYVNELIETYGEDVDEFKRV